MLDCLWFSSGHFPSASPALPVYEGTDPPRLPAGVGRTLCTNNYGKKISQMGRIKGESGLTTDSTDFHRKWSLSTNDVLNFTQRSQRLRSGRREKLDVMSFCVFP
jgi:hypothetical protein